MCVGTYTEGPAKTAGNFTATPGIKAGLKETKIDMGKFYASKDFYDPVKDRRINWGWATTAGPTQVQSLPRDITWHPELQQLVYAPVDEQKSLREKQIGGFTGNLAAGLEKGLGLPQGAGQQSEIMVSFDRPSQNATLGVKVMVDTFHATDKDATLFTVEYIQGANSAKVGGGGVFDTLKLLDSDETIDMRLYVDNTFTEVYFQGGRVAMTVNTRANHGDGDVSVSSSVALQTVEAVAWSVSSIWVTPEQVMQTPRLDGKPIDAWKSLINNAVSAVEYV